jgi:eukaryotic translation initiation factor 2C
MPVPDIFILLMVNKNQELYSSFKYLADKVFVFQSICMTMASMRGANITQYMANVAMKANLKMAGINHSAQGIDTWLDKTLVLGADCTHPGSGAVKGSPSVTAVVGSLEANGGRFCGKLRLQPGKQEVYVLMQQTRTILY